MVMMPLVVRLAWRLLRRNATRSLLMAVLVALPLGAAVALAALGVSADVPAGTRAGLSLGEAQARLMRAGVTDDGVMAQLARDETELDRSGLDVSLLHAEVTALASMRAAQREAAATYVAVDDPQSGVFHGRFPVTQGLLPQPRTAQVAVSSAIADVLGLTVGSQLQVSPGTAATVTGIVVDARDTDRLWIVAPLDFMLAAELATPPGAGPPVVSWAIPFGLAIPSEVLHGGDWTIIDQRFAQGSADPVLSGLLPAVAPTLLVVVVLAGAVCMAGFAASAAQYRREFSVLGLVGASPRKLRSVVAVQGALLGAAAVAFALVIGVVATWIALAPLAQSANQIWGAVPSIDPWATAITAAIGVGLVTGSALAATRHLRRTPVTELLRPTPRKATRPDHRHQWPVLVAGATVLAAATYLWSISAATPLAAVVVIAGVGTLGAAISWRLQRQHRSLGASTVAAIPRRTMITQPGRTIGQVVAVATVVSIAGFVLITFGGIVEKIKRSNLPSLPAGAAQLYTAGPATARLPSDISSLLESPDPVEFSFAEQASDQPLLLTTAAIECHHRDTGCTPEEDAAVLRIGAPQFVAAVTSPQDMARLVGRELTPSEAKVIRAGGVLVRGPEFLEGTAVRLMNGPEANPPTAALLSDTSPLDGSALPNGYCLAGSSVLCQPSETNVFWYYPPQSGRIAIPDELKARADYLITAAAFNGGFLDIDREPPAYKAIRIIYITVLAALVVLIGVITGLITTLAARDTAADRQTLLAIGANSHTVRRTLTRAVVPATITGAAAGIVITGFSAYAQAASGTAPLAWQPWIVLIAGSAIGTAIALQISRVLTVEPGLPQPG